MATYNVNLTADQLKLLIDLTQTTIDRLQSETRRGVLDRMDPMEFAEVTLDAFSRGPKLVAYLEEQRNLEPVRAYVDEEET